MGTRAPGPDQGAGVCLCRLTALFGVMSESGWIVCAQANQPPYDAHPGSLDSSARSIDFSQIPPNPPTPIRPPQQAFCIKHKLPLGFLIGLIWALLWPEPGQRTFQIVVGKTRTSPEGLHLIEFLNNANVFLVSGLTLRTDEFRHLARHWTAPAYGLVAILFITPLLALAAKVRVRVFGFLHGH